MFWIQEYFLNNFLVKIEYISFGYFKTKNNIFSMDKNRLYNIALSILLIVSLGLLIIENSRVTGNMIEGTTWSNVTIAKYLSIAFSSSLASGIDFGNVQSLPLVNVNGSHNYDGSGNATNYYIEVSPDSNTAVDFCVVASGDLQTSALDTLGLSNESYAASSTSDSATPALASEVTLTTGYVKAISSVATNSSAYWRFWLDVPAAQPTGSYNNTVSFKGISTGGSC